MYQQISKYRYELLAYILFNKVFLIHLIRANYLDIIVSQSTALARGVYHFHSRDNIENVKVRLDTLNLVDRLTQQEKQICDAKSWYSKLGLPYMEVTYEELVADTNNFNKILAFIGIEPHAAKLSSSLKKINLKSHAELIANYDSVKATLQATHFYEFLR
jgi:LPS sulfotransferase NodH